MIIIVDDHINHINQTHRSVVTIYQYHTQGQYETYIKKVKILMIIVIERFH